MDVLFLSRLQFAVTAGFHFLFVPMTLGVVVLIAIMQTLWYRTNDEAWLKLSKFFGRLFLINFAIGVVTGISLEFQFGMNWARYSKYVGDIFGVPLAIEATAAFFLESTFLGLWIFGWNKISKKIHLFSVWMVAIGSNLSALWILFANAFMQQPVGFNVVNGRVELVDFASFIMSRYGWVKFFHTVFASYCVGAFFVMAVSAWHILKKKNGAETFKKSFKLASCFLLASSALVFVFGDFHAKDISLFQPSKFAAMESVWDSGKGMSYPLIVLPDEKNERNMLEAIKIPYMLSILATYDPHGEIKGLRDIPREDRPPVILTFLSFRLMVVLGILFIFISILSAWLSWKDKIENPLFLKVIIFSLPLPYLAMQLGWIVAEVGRQPWAVYGLLRTADAVSANLSSGQVWFSLIGYFLMYSFLGFTGFYLMLKNASKELGS